VNFVIDHDEFLSLKSNYILYCHQNIQKCNLKQK